MSFSRSYPRLALTMLGLMAIAAVLVWGNGNVAQAATLIVTKTGDTNDGVCDADCSLREAIGAASPGDTVQLPAGTYTLTPSSGFSGLVLFKDLTITGDGKFTTIIQANADPGVATYRVFETTATVSISGVTIRHGVSDSGAGIYNTGALTLTGSAVNDNSATNFGGGIVNGGALTLTDSAVSGNVVGSYGGGIYNDNSDTLTIINSTVSNNTAIHGGGISNGGTLNITNTIISGNSAGGDGGGIYNDSSSTLILTSSTVSGNSATSSGGIYNNAGTLALTNSALSGNSASHAGGGMITNGGTLTITGSTISGNSASDHIGGIDNNGGTLTLTSSLLAVNSAPDSPDCRGNIASALGYNLVGNNDGCSFTPATGDQVGTPVTPIDPLLGPLADNGGFTMTHALLPGSPAIDAGSCSDADGNPVPTDQRGVTRPQGAGCDIGSFELELETPVNHAPESFFDVFFTLEDTSLDAPAPGVLENDTDADGDALTAVLVSDVSNGSLTLGASGGFTYVPNMNFYGEDSFTYYASDGATGSAVATVTINVEPVNDAPVANADAYSTIAGVMLAVSAPGVLGNDTDADSEPLVAFIYGDPDHGIVLGNADGSFTYTPDAGFTGADSFTYQASDGTTGSNVATVSVTALPAPAVPTCNGLAATIIGSQDDDILTGTMGQDVIVGLDGNDIVRGLGGNDVICGGPGNDILMGNLGDDWLDGGQGNDVLVGGLGDDKLYGRDGHDILMGAQGNDLLEGGPGDDILRAGGPADSPAPLEIDASPGDRLNGGSGDDLCIGGQASGCE